MKETILNLIKKSGENFIVSGSVNKKIIDKIESELGVKLPESYKWYVENYGHGGIGNIEIYGVALNDSLTVVDRTNDFRNYGLPTHLVEILNMDEWIYCLDTEHMRDGECPVVEWSKEDGIGTHKFENFFYFLYEQFNDKLQFLSDEGLL